MGLLAKLQVGYRVILRDIYAWCCIVYVTSGRNSTVWGTVLDILFLAFLCVTNLLLSFMTKWPIEPNFKSYHLMVCSGGMLIQLTVQNHAGSVIKALVCGLPSLPLLARVLEWAFVYDGV